MKGPRLYANDSARKKLYQEMIQSGTARAGYACDDLAGVPFRNGAFEKAVSLNEKNNAYFVTLTGGKVAEQKAGLGDR